MIYNSEKLTSEINGINGTLQLLQDERLNNDTIRELYYESEIEFLNAKIRIIDDNDKIISTIILNYPVADLNIEHLYGNDRPTYLITVNNYTGMGSYTGYATELLEIENGKVRYCIENGDFLRSLKSDWKIDYYKNSKFKQIFVVSCHMGDDFKDFVIDYIRYYFDGNKWQRNIKTVKGFWESGEEDFPSYDLFP